MYISLKKYSALSARLYRVNYVSENRIVILGIHQLEHYCSRAIFTLKSSLNDMRAVLVKDGKGPVENLYIGEAPKPTLGKGEVLVKESYPWNIYNLDIESSF